MARFATALGFTLGRRRFRKCRHQGALFPLTSHVAPATGIFRWGRAVSSLGWFGGSGVNSGGRGEPGTIPARPVQLVVESGRAHSPIRAGPP